MKDQVNRLLFWGELCEKYLLKCLPTVDLVQEITLAYLPLQSTLSYRGHSNQHLVTGVASSHSITVSTLALLKVKFLGKTSGMDITECVGKVIVDSEVSELQEILQQRNDEYRKKFKECELLEQTLTETKKSLEETQERLKQTKVKLAERDAQVSTLDSELSKAQEEISGAAKQLEELKRILEDSKKELRDKDQQMDDLRDSLNQ
ncbi:Hypothetical predicted protein, partial [Paramuricea clavata]